MSGNVYDVVTDIRIPCPDIDLVFRRSYSSHSDVIGDLGYGWSHSYDWRVRVSGDKVIVRASGDNGSSDADHTFPSVARGGRVSNADGYLLSRDFAGRYELTTPGRMRYSFSDQGLLVAITAWNGTRVVVQRDSEGQRIEAVRHACGKSLVFSYSGDALVGVSAPGGSVRLEFRQGVSGCFRQLEGVVWRDGAHSSSNAYEYVRRPRPGSWTSPSGGYFTASPTHNYAYARVGGGGAKAVVSGGHTYVALASAAVRPASVSLTTVPVLSRKTDANGISAHYEYDRLTESPKVRCRAMSMTGGLLEATFSYHDGLTVERKPTAGGDVETRILYDSSRRETCRRRGDESLWTSYDGAGNAEWTVRTNALHRLANYRTYDGFHRVTSVSTAFDGIPRHRTRLGWDERRGILNRVVSPEGRVREWVTNGDDVVVYGAGARDARLVTHRIGDANGHVRVVLGSDGGRTDISYDRGGYVSGIATEGLPPAAFAHDALGHVSSLALPGPAGTTRTVSFVNNGRGRPLSVSRPDGTSESFAYDGNGTRVVRHVDALGREDVYRCVLGLPVHAGRVIGGVTNALFSVSHDQQLNVVAIADPLGRPAESYVLDLNERVIAVTNLEGQAMTRTYALGKMVASETRFDGTQVAYGYGSDANLASVAYPDDTLRFGYDRDGLMTSAANASGTVSNVYDAATGWLDSSVGVDGSAVSYLHSNGGSVTGVVFAAGTIRHVLDVAGRRVRTDSPAGSVRYGYCPWNGLVAAVTNANGVTATYAYDVMNRVTNIAWRTASGSRLGGFAYRYDAVGRIVSRTHDLGGATFDRDYAYDDMDRLASDGGTAYAYDAAGNRMTRTEDGETVAYALGQGDRLASWTGGSYQHDAAGCVTHITRGADTWDLTWNGQYQLVSVSTNGAFAESYSYDALGRRVTTTNLAGTERHVYDDSWQVVADLDEDGNVLRSYVWGEGIDRLFAVKIGSRTYTALTDVQGTVWGYADEAGDVVARWTYDAWGNVLSEEVDASVAELRAVRYRFQGRERSAATGLTNFRMRWYDAVTGRWLSKDPIGLSGGLNLYAFCGGAPYDLDPLGLIAIAIGGLGSAGASAGGSAGSGIVLGYSAKNGFQIGTYQTGSIGSHIGLDASFGTAITIALGAEDICDLSGAGVSTGGSGGAAVSIGGDVNIPLGGNPKGASFSVFGGAGVGVEGHVTTTYTTVQRLW